VLTDDEIVAAFPTSDLIQRAHPAHPDDLDYQLLDAVWRVGEVDFAIKQRSGERARLVISLPSSGAPQFWLYGAPHDAADWVAQLLLWIGEEVLTGGLGGSRARVVLGGDSYVIAENYGWRVAESARHEKLKAAAGPFGWAGGGEA